MSVTPVGNLDYATSVACYQPSLQAHLPTSMPFGLPEQSVYLYGGWKDASGALHIVERKFVGPMTAGLWLMHNRSGGLTLAPESLQTVKGEVRRHYSDTEHHLHGSLLGKAGGEADDALDIRLGEGTLAWQEGPHLALDGRLVGPGIQIGSLDATEPFFYLSELYEVTGTVLGEPVDGFVFIDHGYWSHGRDWKEFRVFEELELSWSAFATRFEDGSIEWGQVSAGKRGFNFVAVADRQGPVVMETDTRFAVDPDPEDWAQRIAWRTSDDRAWVFELAPGAMMGAFSKARWGGYRAQAGSILRHGEDRPVDIAVAWGESFMDRFREVGAPSVDDLLVDL